jgi:glycerol-3-phosphate dehydrogenase
MVRARVFVNAAGPYSDDLRLLAMPNASRRLVLSKGVHILLPLDPGVTSALLIPKTEDGRVIFAIPWLGRLLVGTTDQEVTRDEKMLVTRDEADYLLRHLNRYTARSYRVEDVVSAFAGIRPLVRPKHAHETKNLIREHEVETDNSSGLISILGGKWTTYRAMAEDTIDAVQDVLAVRRKSTSTRHHRVAGAEGYAAEQWKSLAREHCLEEETARHLSEKFGGNAFAVLAIAEENPELKQRLISGASPIQAEVVYCARHEMAVTIEDVLARRIGLQFFSWKLAVEAAHTVAQQLARELGWSEGQKQQATHDYVSKIERSLEAIGLRKD